MNSKSMCRAWMFGPVLSLSVAFASCNGPVPMGTKSFSGSGNASGSGGSSSSGSGEGSGLGTGTKINLDPGSTSTGVATDTQVTEQHACNVATNTATKQNGDLLLILDRSSSMNSAIDSDAQCTGGGVGRRRDASAATCQSRWEVVQSTLKQVLAASEKDVNWGLAMYSTPGQGSCTVADKVQVEVGAGNGDKILTQISAAGTETSTPTRKAVNAGVKYLQGLKGTESKSILLATDGQPNCAGDSTTAGGGSDDVGPATDAIKAASAAGFKVYILGIGPEANATTLNGFAEAGGTAIKDVSGAGKNYYAALSAEELAKHFGRIVSSVASCTFTLDTAPDSTVPVAVEFDGDKNKRAPQDGADGWNYSTADRKTIQLYGSWCDGLMNGTYKVAKVLVGCKGQPIP